MFPPAYPVTVKKMDYAPLRSPLTVLVKPFTVLLHSIAFHLSQLSIFLVACLTNRLISMIFSLRFLITLADCLDEVQTSFNKITVYQPSRI